MIYNVIEDENDVLATLLFLSFPIVCFYGEKSFSKSIWLLSFCTFCYLAFEFIRADPTARPVSDDPFMSGDFTRDILSPSSPIVITLLAVLVGVTGASIISCFFEYAVIFAGCICATILGNFLYQLVFSFDFSFLDVEALESIRYITIIIAALIGGYLAIAFTRSILRISTAFVGAYMCVAAVDHFGYKLGYWRTLSLDPGPDSAFFADPQDFHCGPSSPMCMWLSVAWVALFALGLSIQFGCGSKEKPMRHLLESQYSTYGSYTPRSAYV